MKSIDKVWVKINAKEVEVKNGTKLLEIIKDFKFDINRIAVEKNGEILSKNLWKDDLLSKNDNYEIVEFVGGG
ncbi:sulfur carrier protein ThiS [Campylobacter ureolyticus]|uniref:Sulfur carrier protein ThiS n=1 Tax=Campylobacter ureolyticus TaxID=827 RepID=A0A9Q4PUD6_9BACT|nr:sulfur carrier protein ThiS [Campylobacter ureolyticus]MCZ6103842.1 sulfur carrier protein ThiS [Campylobacter ureolyticus]MCZ6134706.1 sulfur carrier protein ThiS [Campylobacter ureolyticus]MCZ6161992.1 sulfur carrier protein ThiS [Campylobacter ureolyticus]MCZ6170933.1 sulfur carrier protein ThiS [Campylobacter ureolyticus]MCZ6173002.1 sulfur carrier protein ThiS [Campylobacter ureolyticus]